MNPRSGSRAKSPVTVLEWDIILPGTLGDLKAFEELHAWALGDTGRKVLEAGAGRIRVLNHVGVIITRSGFVLEVLPKTEDGLDRQASRALLLNMLTRSGMIAADTRQIAPSAVAKLPLTSALVGLFLAEMTALVKHGLSASYETKESLLPYIRGRVSWGEYARRMGRPDGLPCVFDPMTLNTIENRIIATAFRICLSAGLAEGSIVRARFLEDSLEGVQSFSSPRLALDALRSVSTDRKNHAYWKALALARLILEGLNITGTWASTIRFSLFFPMEKVFERFVYAELLAMQRNGIIRSARYQSNPYFLLRYDTGSGEKRYFNLKPDFFVKGNAGEKWILDAKWKLLDEDAVDGKNGINQSDLYQLLAYASIYRGEDDAVDRIFLVYPKWSGFSIPIDYSYSDVHVTPLHIIPIPIDGTGQLSLPIYNHTS